MSDAQSAVARDLGTDRTVFPGIRVDIIYAGYGGPVIVPHQAAQNTEELREKLGSPRLMPHGSDDGKFTPEIKLIRFYMNYPDEYVQEICRSLVKLEVQAPEIIRLCRLLAQRP